jgi:hypothetical protein
MRFTGGVTTTYIPSPREGKAKEAAETNPEGIAEALPDDTIAVPEGSQTPTPGSSPAPSVQPRPKPATP